MKGRGAARANGGRRERSAEGRSMQGRRGGQRAYTGPERYVSGTYLLAPEVAKPATEGTAQHGEALAAGASAIILNVFSRGIYVEVRIRAPMDALWELTQRPDLHARWDLRFTSISYLPRAGESGPQRFRYETRMGFGVRVRGDGETTGTKEAPGGARASALRFWSADPKSLIRRGSGYWRYVPADAAVTFPTPDGYQERHG